MDGQFTQSGANFALFFGLAIQAYESTLVSDNTRLNLPATVTVNNQTAQVLYAGVAPGLVEGANQINIKLPAHLLLFGRLPTSQS